jgi:hypothetical protein
MMSPAPEPPTRASQSFGELRSPMPLARFRPCRSSGSRCRIFLLDVIILAALAAGAVDAQEADDLRQGGR